MIEECASCRYRYDMSIEEAAELARRAIYHATFRDGASGGVASGTTLSRSLCTCTQVLSSLTHGNNLGCIMYGDFFGSAYKIPA